jgi:sec-independent protein translocase protein TatA
MFGLGTTELVIIGAIIFIIFGAKRIPEIGKGLGGALKEFRNIKKEINDDDVSEGSANTKQVESPKEDSIEKKLAGKIVNQVPVVKKANHIKDTVDQVKKVVS